MRARVLGSAAAIVLMIGMLGACAPSARTLSDPPVDAPVPSETLFHGEDVEGAPPGFVLRYDETELRLPAWAFEYSGMAREGYDPDPPSIGSPAELLVFVPGADFQLQGVTQFTNERFSTESRNIQPDVEDLGDGWWRITPKGDADEYTVDLSAFTPMFTQAETGSMSASVRWTTTTDAGLPPATATLSLMAYDDTMEEPEAWDLELAIGGLSIDPASATASVTVASSDGRSTVLVPELQDFTSVGDLYFLLKQEQTQAAARLGDGPFTYDVEVVIDGVIHTARAEYASGSTSVPLEFDPPLP